MAISEEQLWSVMRAADEIGVKIEFAAGVPLWEAMPSPRHQRVVKAIDASLTRNRSQGSDCGCVSYMDVAVRFPDGSFKRPDISVFCREPDEEDQAVTLVPEAVIEVVSQGYESKDFQFGPPFYLGQGVKDVVIVEPLTLLVLHIRSGGTRRLTSPVTIELECGCLVTV